jgi:hypothetical protein
MKIKMTEYLQGNGISGISEKTGETVTVLEPNGVYEVDSVLAEFILSNRKGSEVKSQPVREEVKDETPKVEESPTVTPEKKFKRGR